MAERYVVVGLAPSRCRWFNELPRWATAGVAPIEFVKCLTPDEVRAVLGAGRPASMLLVDAGLGRFDRDVIAAASRAGVPALLVEDPRIDRDWESLGCVSSLGTDFSRDQLVAALGRWGRRVDAVRRPARAEFGTTRRGRLIGVTGTGGAGSSTVAMALAQGLAVDSEVALVDGCRRADLGMYHDVGDVIPGLPELVELHRGDTVDPDQVRSLLFDIDDRGYHLLLGLRRPRDWAGMRSRAVEAALDGLLRTHDTVVVDHDPDVEGEAETGSVDIEDRHALARTAVAAADLVMVVARPGVKGVHDLARVVDDLVLHGLPADRVQPVLNGVRRSAPLRAQLARAVRDVTARPPGTGASVARPVFLHHLRDLESRHRTAEPLPDTWCRTLAGVVTDVPARTAPPAAEPDLVRPGELATRIRIGDVA